MKTVKFLFGIAIVALLAIMFLFSTKARADGMHGVTVTDKEVLVQVPKFCRPLKVVWEVQWEQNATNEEAILSFVQRNEKKLNVLHLQNGVVKVETVWSGGMTVHIQKFDAKDNRIQYKLVSILVYGDDDRAFDTNNWHYESQSSRWVNGARVSPPVNAGVWGKCK